MLRIHFALETQSLKVLRAGADLATEPADHEGDAMFTYHSVSASGQKIAQFPDDCSLVLEVLLDLKPIHGGRAGSRACAFSRELPVLALHHNRKEAGKCSVTYCRERISECPNGTFKSKTRIYVGKNY